MLLNRKLLWDLECISIVGELSHLAKELAVKTNSKEVERGDIFVALKGERFDAFDFIDQALVLKAGVVVYNYSEDREAQLVNWLDGNSAMLMGVKDTTLFLQQLAQANLTYWREQFAGKVIAITGSNGKTTNKEMLAHILDTLFPGEVHSTWKNFNNHIGVPLTIFNLTTKHRYLILELGTNHPGEIALLAQLVEPEYGYITNIGESHLEFFKSAENVFLEKRSLFQVWQRRVFPDKKFLINCEDKYLQSLEKSEGTITIGCRTDVDFQVTITHSSSEIVWNKQNYRLSSPALWGEHNYYNLAMAFALLSSMFPHFVDDIQQAANAFKPRHNRSEIIKRGEKRIFLDAYNANPSSMRASVSAFWAYLQPDDYSRAVIILGDMNELGEQSKEAHCSLAKFLSALVGDKIGKVIFVGRFEDSFRQGVDAKLNYEGFATTVELQQKWPEIEGNYLFLFLKASRSLQFESLIGIS